MKISQEQLREAAQILYPRQWKEDRIGAVILTLKYLDEFNFDFETRPPAAKAKKSEQIARSQEISQLEEHLKTNKIHVTAAARSIGVNAVTLYSWFHGHSEPKTENLEKIRAFLNKTKA